MIRSTPVKYSVTPVPRIAGAQPTRADVVVARNSPKMRRYSTPHVAVTPTEEIRRIALPTGSRTFRAGGYEPPPRNATPRSAGGLRQMSEIVSKFRLAVDVVHTGVHTTAPLPWPRRSAPGVLGRRHPAAQRRCCGRALRIAIER